MRRLKLMTTAGATLLAFGLAAAAPAPATAQDTSSQRMETSGARDNQERRHDTDWGWLGLLGLGGLAGLRRHHQHEEPARQRSAAL